MKAAILKLAQMVWSNSQSFRPSDLLLPPSNDYRALLYMGDNTPGAEHIYRQWFDIFEASGVSYFALFRHRTMFARARSERPDAPISLARTAPAVGALIKSQRRLCAAFYSGNPGNVAHMMPYHHFKHIFIGHGDSDKSTSASRMFRLYDEIWVAGEAHVDRLQGVISKDVKIKVVGRPQLASAVEREACRQSDNPRPVFVYLPTWEGPREDSNYSSISMAEEIARRIAKVGCEVKVKFHPSTGARCKKFRNADAVLGKNRLFAEGSNEILDRACPATVVMEAGDYCVTDVSSIVSDWVIRDRPIFVFKPTHVDTSESRRPVDTYCYTFSSAAELGNELARVVQDGDDYKAGARRLAAEYLVSREATLSGEFAHLLRASCSDASLADRSLIS